MEINKKQIENKKAGSNALNFWKVGAFLLRWLYLFALIGALIYAFSTWNKYVQNAEWSDAQKKDYVNQQAVFSFDQGEFQKALDFYAARQNKLQNNEKFSGRDIFFPE
jgi:hypothetical protein